MRPQLDVTQDDTRATMTRSLALLAVAVPHFEWLQVCLGQFHLVVFLSRPQLLQQLLDLSDLLVGCRLA